jgi:hypothetical protein
MLQPAAELTMQDPVHQGFGPERQCPACRQTLVNCQEHHPLTNSPTRGDEDISPLVNGCLQAPLQVALRVTSHTQVCHLSQRDTECAGGAAGSKHRVAGVLFLMPPLVGGALQLHSVLSILSSVPVIKPRALTPVHDLRQLWLTHPAHLAPRLGSCSQQH